MSERAEGARRASVGPTEESGPTGPVIRDKRRIDPQTGDLREPPTPTTPDTGVPQGSDPVGEQPEPHTGGPDTAQQAPQDSPTGGSERMAGSVPDPRADSGPDTDLAEDLRRDLQRLNAEYINYKRRVDRDRELHRDLAIASVLEALLPVLDDISLAREHGDLEAGPLASIADKLDATLARFGVQRYGEIGVPFDPTEHEALMHTQAELPEGAEVTTVTQVLQPGYRINNRVVRAARVAVADPQ